MIKAIDLFKSFGPQKALNGFELNLKKGEILGLHGPNGSGKSTFMKIIAGGILKYDGEVLIDKMSPSLITKNKVSYLSDNNLFPDGNTVQETIEFYRHFYKDFDMDHFFQILQKLNVNLSMKTKLIELSKGIRQLIRIALCMARDVELYLLDEPLAGIDPIAVEVVIDTLVDSMHEKSTMIIATHEVAIIERILTRVIFIKDGHSCGDYDCEEVRLNEGLSIESKYKEIFSHA